MANKFIAPSEMIINADGSVFHLHLRPEQLTDRIILVGDPGRVDMVASFFDEKTFEVSQGSSTQSEAYLRGNPSCA